jgi:hypothetical protein
MRRFLQLVLWLAVLCSTLPSLSAQAVPFHTHTDWQLKPSLKYDALCLLNVLSGDPYYLHYYQAEYDHFHPLFNPGEQAAFVQLGLQMLSQMGSFAGAACRTLLRASFRPHNVRQLV